MKITLYGLYEKDELVYVGVTETSLERRMQGHRKFQRKVHTVKPLMYFSSREDAESWEHTFIVTFRPKLNEATGPGTTGVVQSEEWKQKKVKSRSWYTEHPKDTIERMREAKRAKMHKIICHQNGKTYESIAAACRDLGVHSSKVSQVVRGKRKSVKGYTFARID
jgi:hypothetical protein